MPEKCFRPSVLGLVVLVGAIFALSAVVLGVMLPLSPCPACHLTGVYVPTCDDGIGRRPCKMCSHQGRVPYFTIWTGRLVQN